MEEIVIIDGKQYKLMYDHSLTEEQKIQTITDIRKQADKEIDLGIQNLQPPVGTYEQPFSGCVGLSIMQPGPAITIQSVDINGATPDFGLCGCYPSPCDPPGYCNGTIACPGGTCMATVTWINIGDADGTFTSQITIDGGGPIIGDPATVTVAAQSDTIPGMAIQTFSLPLPPGNHNICINTDTITSPPV